MSHYVGAKGISPDKMPDFSRFEKSSTPAPATSAAGELPKAREGWMTPHPVTLSPTHVVTREDYDFLFEQASSSLAALREQLARAQKEASGG